ncbi:hypothetical protein [Hansschlegelia zhihuaiae]|uniref:Uncharacterized protein n=1 Tax=Hansschlegelia zhihuaiae TaxID=405005 RepID=A0A4Q0MK29_9HYPH|nr:hypothetical protein [Hansschlegelia zhihuaiae]RXF73835.1 hypothetical protein EK403_07605 [Hansschlegelia zhihuaiae]
MTALQICPRLSSLQKTPLPAFAGWVVAVSREPNEVCASACPETATMNPNANAPNVFRAAIAPSSRAARPRAQTTASARVKAGDK